MSRMKRCIFTNFQTKRHSSPCETMWNQVNNCYHNVGLIGDIYVNMKTSWYKHLTADIWKTSSLTWASLLRLWQLHIWEHRCTCTLMDTVSHLSTLLVRSHRRRLVEDIVHAITRTPDNDTRMMLFDLYKHQCCRGRILRIESCRRYENAIKIQNSHE